MAKHNSLKYIEWEPSDFKKHGFIATYALGNCRCRKCKNRWAAWDQPWKETYRTPES